MNSPDILKLAKQGNVEAIASLINQQLQSKGITAKIDIKNNCLQVILESSEVPNQEMLVQFIRKGITSLKIVSVERVKVYGRQIGNDFPAWTNEFEILSQPDFTQPVEQTKKNEYYDIEGSNGQIRLTRNRVIISRKGATAFITQGLKGDKEIPINRITAMQIKRPDALTKGYLQFSIQGGLESKGGVFAAVSDENTVMFVDIQEPGFLEVKRYIDSIIDGETISFDTLKFPEINNIYQQNKEKIINTRQKISISNSKSRKTTAILAILLGGYGIHFFYLDAWGWGILSLVFCWTFIPSIVGLILGIRYLMMSDKEFQVKTKDLIGNSFGKIEI